jgi:hypothetical protein
MRKRFIAMFVVPLIAALTVQAAAASERHHMRTKDRAVATERLRNSNAWYAAPLDNLVPSYSSNGYDGGLGSGIAGH